MAKRKLQVNEVWAEIQTLWDGASPILASELKDRLTSAGKSDLVYRMKDLKEAGYMRGRVSVDANKNIVHEYVTTGE